MAKNQDIFITRTPNSVGVTFVNADGATDVTGSSNTKTIATAGSDDSIVRMISVTSDDTSARDLMLFINTGSTNYLIGIINIPITAGSATSVASVNGLNTAALPFLRADKDGNRIIALKTGYTLKCGMKVAATAAKTITVVCTSEDF